MNLKSWNLINNDNTVKELDKKIMVSNGDLFLLNTEKNCFNIIEIYVYKLAMFHFDRMGIVYDKNKYFIEFWHKKKNIQKNENNNGYGHDLHFDKDENYYKKTKKTINPLLSTITYLNDTDDPTFITNITNNDYDEYVINDKVEFSLSFPKKMKHICFNSKFLHGSINMDDKLTKRFLLMFNIWNKKPIDIDYYVNDDIEKMYDKLYSNNINYFDLIEKEIKIIKVDNEFLNKKFLSDIIIKKKNIRIVIKEFLEKINIKIEQLGDISLFV